MERDFSKICPTKLVSRFDQIANILNNFAITVNYGLVYWKTFTTSDNTNTSTSAKDISGASRSHSRSRLITLKISFAFRGYTVIPHFSDIAKKFIPSTTGLFEKLRALHLLSNPQDTSERLG